MKKARYLIAVLLTLLFIGCKKSSTGTDSSSPSLAIRFVNTGSGDFSISGDPDGYYDFCYEAKSCSPSGSGGFGSTTWEGQKDIFVQSETDEKAVGVIMDFYVTKGSGKVEILRGTSHGEDFFDENYGFDVEKVVDTEGPFSKGDEIKISYGNMGN